MSVEKREIRRALRQQRCRLSAAAVEAAGAAVWCQLASLSTYHRARSVLAYIAAENEVPTQQLIEHVARSSRRLYLPRQGVDGPAVVGWQPGEPLQIGIGGVHEPVHSETVSLALPAVALLPIVAWNADGMRVGRGGGFYDRLFATLSPAIVRIGLGYEFQCVEGLPRDPWDVLLHYIVTEQRLICCGPPQAVGPELLQKGGVQL
jgi:5-formyltetrahydrofolate cyclo-ligase